MKQEEVGAIVAPYAEHQFFSLIKKANPNPQQLRVILAVTTFVLRAFFREGRDTWSHFNSIKGKRNKTIAWLIHGMYFNHEKQDSSFAIVGDRLKSEFGYTEGNLYSFFASVEPKSHEQFAVLSEPLSQFEKSLHQALSKNGESSVYASLALLQGYFLNCEEILLPLGVEAFKHSENGPNGYRIAAHFFPTQEAFMQSISSNEGVTILRNNLNAVFDKALILYERCIEAPHEGGHVEYPKEEKED